mgnify:CR=1 FL=1
MTAETAEKIYMTTKSGMKFSVFFRKNRLTTSDLQNSFCCYLKNPKNKNKVEAKQGEKKK